MNVTLLVHTHPVLHPGYYLAGQDLCWPPCYLVGCSCQGRVNVAMVLVHNHPVLYVLGRDLVGQAQVL